MARPERGPVIFRRLRSLKKLILKQAEEVARLQEEAKEAPDKNRFLLGNPKEKAQLRLEAAHEELKNCITSRPTDAIEAKPIPTSDVTQANVEATEVKFSLDNLKSILSECQKDLMLSPTDLDRAEKYYTCYLIIIATIIDLSHSFYSNIDEKYRPGIAKQISKFENLIKNSASVETQLKDVEYKEALGKIRERQKQVLDKLNEANIHLDDQKRWVQSNLPKLNQALQVLQVALQTVKGAKDAKILLQTIMAQHDQLIFSPPPLIVFDVDESEFSTGSEKKPAALT